MRGTILNREESLSPDKKEINKLRLLIEDENKNQFWFSCFDRNLFMILKSGNVIDFSYMDSGRFKNINSATLFITGREYFQERQEKIMKSLCLKIAGSQVKGDASDVISYARGLYQTLQKDGFMEVKNDQDSKNL